VGGLYIAGVPSGFTKGWPATESELGSGELLGLTFSRKNHTDRYATSNPRLRGRAVEI